MQSTVNIQKSVTVERTPIHYLGLEVHSPSDTGLMMRGRLSQKRNAILCRDATRRYYNNVKQTLSYFFLHLQPNSEFGSSFPLVSNDSQTVGGKADKNNNETTGGKKRFGPVNQGNDDYFIITTEVAGEVASCP